MSADRAPVSKCSPIRKKRYGIWFIVLVGLGLGGIGCFGESLLPQTRVEWSQVKFFCYPGNWPLWVSYVLWIAVAGLAFEWITRLRKTRTIVAQIGSWFSNKFPTNSALTEMFNRRWDTKWFLKGGKWFHHHLDPQRLSLLIRGFTIFMIVYISFCHFKEVHPWETLVNLALDYPLQPFQQWYDAICRFTGRGLFTWKVLTIPVIVIFFWIWIFSLRRDYYRLLRQVNDTERA